MAKIVPGNIVRFYCNYNQETFEGIVLIYDNLNNRYCIHSDDPDYVGQVMADHVTKSRFNVGEYSCVDDITAYHGKLHRWYEEEDISLIIRVNPPIIKEAHEDGCSCKTCGNFSFMSSPNQEDGSFKCFTCRSNPIRDYY